MLDILAARDRAVRRAVETGIMPNIDLIHAHQRREGFDPCFGRTENVCHRSGCRWFEECAALAVFKPQSRFGTPRGGRRGAGELTGATFGGYRDGPGAASKTAPPDNGSASTTSAQQGTERRELEQVASGAV